MGVTTSSTVAATYEPIATKTASGSVSTLDFTSISGSYTDLILICDWAAGATDYPVSLRFNSDTGSNYSNTEMRGNGSTTGSHRNSNQTEMYLAEYVTGATSFSSNAIFQIMNYANTTTYKTVLARSNNAVGGGSSGTEANVGLWRSTSAITTITVKTGGTNFAAGSTFTLYGIKAA